MRRGPVPMNETRICPLKSSDNTAAGKPTFVVKFVEAIEQRIRN